MYRQTDVEHNLNWARSTKSGGWWIW